MASQSKKEYERINMEKIQYLYIAEETTDLRLDNYETIIIFKMHKYVRINFK